jgi:hypothetical protein
VPFRIYQLASPLDVGASWRNYDGTTTIYTGGTPAVNAITLTVSNNYEEPVTIEPGPPAEIGELPPGASSCYLYFNGLLSNAEVEAVRVATEGWSSAVFTDEDGRSYLAFAPDEAAVVEAGGQVALSLDGVLASGQPTSGYLDLFLFGVKGVDDATNAQIYVSVTPPPQEGNKQLRLLVGWAETDTVYIGADRVNRLLLYLTNPDSQPLVPDGSAAWGPDDPRFRFSVVCGTGAGALTTVDLARQASVGVDHDYGNVWLPPDRDDQGDYPIWLLQPNRNGGGQILGTGERATIVFDITNIVTTLPQGVTHAHIGYQNIPGYNNGFVALQIIKVEPIVIDYFTADPPEITNATGATDVTLRFGVRNAAYVTVFNTRYARETGQIQFEGTATAKVTGTSTFTLQAQNLLTGQQLSQSVTVTVSPDPFQLLPLGTIVMWSGTVAAIPPGWRLCDGVDGRPNLVNKFIRGAARAGSPQPLETGGSDTHKHGASGSTTITAGGLHTHKFPEAWYDQKVDGSKSSSYSVIDRNNTNIKDAATRESVTHTHPATSSVTVNDAIVLPPWFALYYIIRAT